MCVITASIVLFNTSAKLISRLLGKLSADGVCQKIYIIDNSPIPIDFDFSIYPTVEYIKSKNHGYGAGHNQALRRILMYSDFHLVLNPDIYFNDDVLKKLIEYIEHHDDVGLLMPNIVYPDGGSQYLCKLLPSPKNLFLRRFPIPFIKNYILKSNNEYELRFTGYRNEMNVPSLSGCFMLLRVSALKDVGLFDERFFMYAEDLDLSRRIHSSYKTVFYPGATVIHEHAKSSYKNIKMLFFHISSVIKYFNKWGWFFDKERELINQRVLTNLTIKND